MATTLDVVNSCLATMGEAPLNTLAEPHTYKGAAQRILNEANKRIQMPGWWFNTESLTLYPAPATGHMQLPGDCIKWATRVRTPDTLVRQVPKPWLVQRGTRLYDTRTRSFAIEETEATGEIVRLVPFDELPPVVNDYVAAETVLKFQSVYDGDNGRRAELTQALVSARMEARAENVRQAGVNMVNNNVRLQRIKRVTRTLRY